MQVGQSTEDRDDRVGTEAGEVFISLGGMPDRMTGNGGGDTFIFGDELSSRIREMNVVTDFDSTDNLLILIADDYTVSARSGGATIIRGADNGSTFVLGGNVTADNIQILIGSFNDFSV